MRRSLLYFLSCILCLLVTTSTMAQVANQNFNGLSSSTTTSASGYVPSPGDLTFTCTTGDGNHYMSVINGNDNNDFLFGSFGITLTPTNYSYLFNSTVNGSSQGSGSTTFGFHSATSNPFKLVSMVVDGSSFYGVGPGSNTTFTFTGYKNGTPVTGASGTIDLGSASTTNGSITFTQNDGVAQYNWGTLTFDSKWQNIDEIRITGAGTDQVLAIDNIVVGAALTISPTSISNTTIGQSTNQTLTTSGGTAPYTYAVTAGTLIPGLTLSSGGVISGQPTRAGSYSFTVTATDAASVTGTQVYSGTVSAPMFPINVLPAVTGPTNGTVGVSYPTYSLAGDNGTAPYSFSIQSGSFPAGLSLSSTGDITGTPTAGGSFSFVVKATDSSTGTGAPFSGTRGYTFSISAPTIILSPTSFTNATVGTAYSQSVTASGGTSTYTYAVTAGALPAGLSLSTAGAITGTPTAGGSFNFTITATDSSTGTGPYTGSQAYTLAVGAPTITLSPTTLTAATVATAYSATVTASGGTSTYTYAVTTGALPAGLSLSTAGAITGTPTAGGAFNFTITATDSSTGTGAPYTGSQAYTLTVNAPTITVSPSTLTAAKVGVAYSQSVTASGGTSTYTYAITAGALPAGLTLASNGTLSGTPTAGGTFNFTITATDSSTGTGAPYTGSQAYTFTVNVPTITLTPIPGAPVGVAYSRSTAASGGTAPYTYAVTAGSLPTGLTLDSSTGIVSGTPTAVGTFPFSITATDSSTGTGPYASPRGYSLTMVAPTVVIAPTTLPSGSVDLAYSQTVVASGGTSPYSYAVTAGALPAGLTLSSTTGAITGTPTTGGIANFTVTATDNTTGTGAPYTASRAYALTIINIAPTTLPTVLRGVSYNQTVTATGGTAPYTYAVTAGALPGGLSLNASTGVISGTSIASNGTYNFTITATDNASATGSRAYTVNLTPVISPSTVPAATVGAAYSQTFSTTNGTAPYTYAVTAGSLPAGLTLSGNGIFGTPTAGGTFTFTISSTDSSTGGGPYTASQSYTMTVGAPTIIINPGSLPSPSPVVAYNQTLTSSGGTAPYTYAVTAGALPAGISLASNGTLSGQATTLGAYSFTVTSTDNTTGTGPYTKTATYSGTVSGPIPTVSPTSSAGLPAAKVGVPYTATFTASGTNNTPPYTFTKTTGNLPPGLTLASDGTLSGTPTAVGNFTFVIRATDSSPSPGPYGGGRTYTAFAVSAPTIVVGPATVPDGTAGVAYSQSIVATGGTAPYAYAITAGALPAGITLASDGTLSGTSTVAGTFTFTVTATDATTGTGAPYSGATSYTVNFAAPTIALAPTTLPGGTAGVAYSQTVTASGGTSPYTYAVTAGALPAGITLSAAGSLSGTPTVAGNFNFTVTATDGLGFTGTQAYAISLAAPTIVLAPTTIPGGTAGVAYSQTITASGSTSAYTYAVTAGALPAGITLSAAGSLSGTPTVAGNFNFTVTATDGLGFTGTQAYTLSLAAPVITLAPATLTAATVATAYSQTITASGSTSAYTYSVTAGALPAGLTLSSTGTLSGTATAGGTFNFTITATDALSFTGSKAYTLTVNSPTLALAPATLPGGTVNAAYSQTVTASGGTSPYTYAVTAGALPTGVSLAANGTIAGTPTAAGTFNFTVTATDASTGTGPYNTSTAYSIVIGKANQTITFADITATYGDAPITLTGTASSGLAVTYTSSNTSVATVTGNTLNILAAGTATITASQAGNANYNAAIDVPKTLTVNAKALTITATGPAKTYGTALTAGTSTTNFTAGAAVTGQAVTSVTLTPDAAGLSATTAAGAAYTVTPSAATGTGGFVAGNYNITYVPFTGTVGKATLDITANTANKTYGQTLTGAAGSTAFTATGLQNSETIGSVTLAYGTGAAANAAVNTYTGQVTPSAATGGTFTAANYTITYHANDIVVGKANLTITATNKNKIYGDVLTNATGSAEFTPAGLQNGETVGSVSLAYGTGAAANAAVGTYTGQITPSNAAGGTFNANNYTIAYANGNIIVGAKAIAVTADAKTKVYGTTDPALTYQITSGSLVGTDVLTGALTRDAGEAVNTYAIKQGTLGASGNYTVTFTGANFTITPAALLAKATNQTKTYGAANPSFTVTYTGFANGDTEASLTTKPTVTTTATAASPVGTYPLTVTGAASPNYTITYSPGTLTVNPAVLTVTSDNKSRNYGTPNPPFTVTYTGFVNGDDATKLTTAAVATSNATATTAPGNYPITASGAVAANYTFNYVAGTLTIVPLTNTDLSSLTTSAGTLTPVFNTNTFTYKVTVDNTTTTLSLTASFATTAKGTVNGTAIPNGSPSFAVPLNVGDNTITLIITAQDGVTKKTYTINVYRGLAPINITATNILTPNGDGKNDYWIVKDIQLYPKNNVTVYDKGGRVVYTKVGYNNEWDGTLNGAPLVQGTYYYIVNLGPELPSFKGYISIVKASN